nr:MAG TPA: hypothetical protein [Caudoviricetes sp.]
MPLDPSLFLFCNCPPSSKTLGSSGLKMMNRYQIKIIIYYFFNSCELHGTAITMIFQ